MVLSAKMVYFCKTNLTKKTDWNFITNCTSYVHGWETKSIPYQFWTRKKKCM